MEFDDILKNKYIPSIVPLNHFANIKIMNQWEDTK
jgi:hypothetical protein